MQFFLLFLESFIILAVNSVFGTLLLLALRGYIRTRVEEWLFDSLSSYIQNQLSLTLQNPQETARLIKPLLVSIIGEVMKDFKSSQKEGTVKIPFLGKVPASLAQAFITRFLGGSASKSDEGNSPFA